MVAYKKYARKIKKKVYKRKARAGVARSMPAGFATAVKKVFYKNVETKKGVALNPQVAKGTQLENGEITYLDNSPFATSQGTADPQATRTGNRIGDEVTPVGLSIKFMVNLWQRQSSAHFRWMLIRHTPGDLPTDDTLFQFADMNINRQLLSVDTERFTIIAQKNFKIYANNKATGTSNGASSLIADGGVINSGTYYGGPSGTDVEPLGLATKMCSVWIPGKKLGRVMRYQNGSSSLKNYSYTSLIVGYNNWAGGVQSLLAGGIKIGVMDDYLSQFYFKDA